MSQQEDQTWQALLAQSAPAFAGENEPPYGLATRVLAGAREQRRQLDVVERIGLRAIFASFALVAVTGALTLGLHLAGTGDDSDPAVRSMALVEHVPVS